MSCRSRMRACPNRVVVQWDKDDCADMGIVKVDLLGLGMMAVLQDALELVNRTNGPGLGNEPAAPKLAPTQSWSEGAGLDLAHLPPDDPAVYRMLQEADTIGIFQVESRAQMATLPRLRPERFYDIVVEVAIIRPGPIVGQMVHPYPEAAAGAGAGRLPASVARADPRANAWRAAVPGAAAPDGDGRGGIFRRAKRRSCAGPSASSDRSTACSRSKGSCAPAWRRTGSPAPPPSEIIRSITSFALYGFPESHAASFALLVYASAYLKAHYPAAFYTALLNNQPMGFYHPATLVKDAQRHGVRFAPIDVQESDWTCRVDADGRVRLGLMYVNGLRQDVGRALAAPASGDGSNAVDRADARGTIPEHEALQADRCPKCGCDDQSMLEATLPDGYFCNICAHEWGSTSRSGFGARDSGLGIGDSGFGTRDSGLGPGDWQLGPANPPRRVRRAHSSSEGANPEPRYSSIADLIARTRIRRDELATLADIGALNAFGFDRRSALWQVERAVRPTGELFARLDDAEGSANGRASRPHGRATCHASRFPAVQARRSSA